MTSITPSDSASILSGSWLTRTGCCWPCSPTTSRSRRRRSRKNILATPSGFGPAVRDTTTWLQQLRSAKGSRLLFEGAQGSLLDVDHGSYPYVTSSNSSAAGIAAGSGMPTRHIDRWIGVVKAHTTRVGGGPFPTEQDNEAGERIRQVGREFGTGHRPPQTLRAGSMPWPRAIRPGSAARPRSRWMLLDVLSGIPELQVAAACEDGRGVR